MSIVIWLIIIANIILGIIVFAKKPSSRSNVYFSLLALFLSLWAICIFLEDVAPNENLSLILTKADFGFGLRQLADYYFALLGLWANSNTNKPRPLSLLLKIEKLLPEPIFFCPSQSPSFLQAYWAKTCPALREPRLHLVFLEAHSLRHFDRH